MLTHNNVCFTANEEICPFSGKQRLFPWTTTFIYDKMAKIYKELIL